MTNDSIFSTCLKSLDTLYSVTCDNCTICIEIRQLYNEIKPKEPNVVAYKEYRLILEWMYFDEMASFYAKCSNSFDKLGTNTDDQHCHLWNVLLENQQETRRENKAYWRKNFVTFLQRLDFFRFLGLLKVLNVCRRTSMYNFCSQFAVHLDDESSYTFSDVETTVLVHDNDRRAAPTKTYNIINPDVSILDAKGNWQRKLQNFAAKLFQ